MTGVIPPEHYSHDHLNEQREVPVEQERLDRWRDVFSRIEEERATAGEKVVWVIVDGFLLYWNQVRMVRTDSCYVIDTRGLQDVIDTLDVRVFLRIPHNELKHRRDNRSGYHTAGELCFSPPLTSYDVTPTSERARHSTRHADLRPVLCCASPFSLIHTNPG